MNTTPTPRTDAFMQNEQVAFCVLWIDFARRLERELTDFRVRTKEIIDEDHQRILALIHERDTYKSRAEERRALRTEIEQSLGMESKPGDTSDDSLKQGLATIKQLRADLARVTAELQKCSDLCATEDGGGAVADVLARKFARVTAGRDDLRIHYANARKKRDEMEAECERLNKEIFALRARVAELEREAIHAATTTDCSFTVADYRKMKAKIEQAEQRNAELVAHKSRLERAVNRIGFYLAGHAEHDFISKRCLAVLAGEEASELDKSLARAESATPAKHCEDCAPEFGCFDGGEPCYKQPLAKSTPAKCCPKCGAQIMDPFTGTTQIHDVERCNGKARHD